ncbi:MAG: HYR domain-containing protein, partial [Planctomycetota bacterium]
MDDAIREYIGPHANGLSGTTVVPLGDIAANGYTDLAVGSPGAEPIGVGRVQIYKGFQDCNKNGLDDLGEPVPVDEEAPVIFDTPADITQSNDAGFCSAVVTWIEPTATDNCILASLVGSHAPEGSFSVGSTTVTYTATDTYDNPSTSSFIVTVVDNEAPVISGTPADITMGNTTGACTAPVSWTAPTASDNCDVQSLTSTHASGATFSLGTTQVTYTATDIHGNTSTSSFNVIVIDTQDPVIVDLPSSITVASDSGACSSKVSWSDPMAMDNCSISSLIS